MSPQQVIQTSISLLFLVSQAISQNPQTKPSDRYYFQPKSVFIATILNTPCETSAKEAVLIYLEDVFNDKEGNLMLELFYRFSHDDLFGEIENPSRGKKWYFNAKWKINVRGGGYMFNSINSVTFDEPKYGLQKMN